MRAKIDQVDIAALANCHPSDILSRCGSKVSESKISLTWPEADPVVVEEVEWGIHDARRPLFPNFGSGSFVWKSCVISL